MVRILMLMIGECALYTAIPAAEFHLAPQNLHMFHIKSSHLQDQAALDDVVPIDRRCQAVGQ